ncbi:hypothetical protein PCANC_13448 [Puccinia coronata f. sp. avenae]|uniref:Uncharacterized protein n=1 Tax=Puccinia coronata f. sp. avenae TaxID=200324 RepID=A0A2N5SRB0_9BASI|nr:hypothetical protein PCANC_13448 [Puccinia coronata f. sp. avenae]
MLDSPCSTGDRAAGLDQCACQLQDHRLDPPVQSPVKHGGLSYGSPVEQGGEVLGFTREEKWDTWPGYISLETHLADVNKTSGDTNDDMEENRGKQTMTANLQDTKQSHKSELPLATQISSCNKLNSLLTACIKPLLNNSRKNNSSFVDQHRK